MSEQIKHECGIAMVRLLRPISYYKEKYGTALYGLNTLYLLMEKQHNRGQEGAGLACVKLDAKPSQEYIFRERALGSGAIQSLFGTVHEAINQYAELPKDNTPFVGELYMGHLRYSTTGRSGISYVHPFLRRHNWRSRNLALCGNFNMTNVDEIFSHLVEMGQHPRSDSDTFVLLEQLGYELDRENALTFDRLHDTAMSGSQLSRHIEDNLDLPAILRRTAPLWDGGYVICGMTGSGDLFSLRDPKGIRPAFFYANDEIVVVASERPVIQTAMHVTAHEVTELLPGQMLWVTKKGEVKQEQILPIAQNAGCSFERIYFSRGSDCDIYQERKKLGEILTTPILKAVDYDLNHTVFSFIPNTAEVAFYGMLEGLNNYLNHQKIKQLTTGKPLLAQDVEAILNQKVRSEKVAIKDIKLRTFIAEGETRNDLAAHVYDVTYGTVSPHTDNLVVIDDSIVRGTTLKQSIIKILDRLQPRRIVIVSSSPQVRYPDCYGIDMSRMGEFIAFKAAIALLQNRGMQALIDQVYHLSLAQQHLPKEQIVNHVKKIYAPFSDEQISKQIARMLTPKETTAQVEIVYQTLDGLHQAIPNHPGDWYFSGNYPTPGGNRLVNNAFINYIQENNAKR